VNRPEPSPSFPPLTGIFAAGLVLALAAGFTAGCDPNTLAPLLAPTGGGGPAGACTSDFDNIRMVGDFTSPGFSIPDSPQMIEDPLGCIWRVTVRLNAGTVLFKFVTNDDFDTTQDYGGSEAVTLDVPGGPHPTQLVSGTGTAIKVNVATTGDYTFTLNEKTLTWTAEPGAPPPTGGIAGSVTFANLTSAPYPSARVEVFSGATSVAVASSDPTTRAFAVSGLAAGSYRVVVSASCFTTVELAGVTVAGTVNDVGAVALAEGASAFTTIDLVGTFNVFTPGADPMVESPPCVWTRERHLDPGVFNLKFLTDGQFDTPPDYGGDESMVIDVPGGGTVRPVSGPGTAIRISVANPGTYRFVLDERLQRWEATLVTPAPVPLEDR
jgi:hypothetical protein